MEQYFVNTIGDAIIITSETKEKLREDYSF